MENKREIIVRNEDKYVLTSDTSKKIAEIETKMKELKVKEEELKQMILKEMEEKNLLKLDAEELSISYIAPSERETFDSKALKEELPDVYDSYIKFSPVKSSIRIKLK